MNLFWLEFFYFIVAVFAILVSISAAALFVLTFRFEKRLRTTWRAVGFSLLALAFFLLILERKYPGVGLFALIIEFFAFFSIFRGVLAEPILSHLGKDPEKKTESPKGFKTTEVPGKITKNIWEYFKHLLKKKNLKKSIDYLISQFYSNAKMESIPEQKEEIFDVKRWNLWSSILLASAIVFLGIIFIFYHNFIYSFLVLGSLIAIGFTIPIQLKRYVREKRDVKARKQNLYPLLGYICLLASMAVLFFYRLPDLDIVFLRNLKIEYGVVWQIAMILTFAGFLLLAVWAWNFIKLRVFLRTYVAFLTAAIIVSSLGALVFTVLIFKVVEKNNLNLMAQGARTQALAMQDRFDGALVSARAISQDPSVVDGLKKNNTDGISDKLTQYAQNSNLDILRLFDASKKVVFSLSDPREEGRIFSTDPMLHLALTERKQIKSFYSEDAVLAYIMNARSLAPVLSGDEAVGAVEVGYKFDNAYVDWAKEKTGLDITIYTGARRSATTIPTLDGVSRWVGSEETDKNIIKDVLEDGKSYQAIIDRLGRLYYNAFEPLRDVNGVIVGMVAVGVPTNILFENTRMQLVNAFLIMTVISLLVVAAAYLLIQRYQKGA